MLEIELPTPDELARLDDVGLFRTMAIAEGLESAAKHSRLAALEELYARRARSGATVRPRPRPARRPRSRRKRKMRKARR
jgi:hypothetical protein